jgi:hypothetical protein
MRIAYCLIILGLFVSIYSSAQNSTAPNSFNTASIIFKTFEKNLAFLDTKETEVDSLYSKLKDFYNRFNNSKNDSIFLKNYEYSLQNSITNFTNFNARQITTIAHRLRGVQPIRGSEISYLNRSFQVFIKYQNLYNFITTKSYKLKRKYKQKLLNINILESKLNQLSSFYKNYYTTIGHTKIRRILNADDATYNKKDNEFKHLAKNLLSRKNYRLIQKTISRSSSYINPSQLADSSVYYSIKNNTYSKSRIKQDRKRIKHYFNTDKSYKIGQFFTQQLSGAIGNFAGMFRFRKGYLYKNDTLIKNIQNHLQPMDILSEKTGFALTDKMIPGHFGHIAIWLGTQKQLEKNKLWNHPVIRPFQNRIKLGYCILETDRGGTHLKTLKKFMNVDELAITRINDFDNLPLNEKVSIYKNALAQLGKKYDFNFDVETSDKLVCSELLYQVFGSVHWPTDRMLKRATISPDNVMSLVLYQNTPLQLSYYISAKSHKKIQLKNEEALAEDLGYIKQETHYTFPEKKCEKKFIKGKKRKKKICKTTYQPLIYK